MTTKIPPYIVWMWQHYSLNTYECETREEAIGTAIGISDNGDGVLEAIEGPDGELVPAEEIDAEEQRRDAAWYKAQREAPVNTHAVKLYGPNESDSDRNWVWWSSHTSEADAKAEVARLKPRFGDRVKIHEFPVRT
jgi:hypothetical protein